jgi:ankyrin repeat protein
MATDNSESTPLHMAARGGHIAMMRVLLWAGAGVHVRDAEGCTPLHRACGHQAVTVLLAAGAAVDAVSSKGSTALHMASVQYPSCAQAVHALLAAGASVHALDEDGQTPLLCASECDCMEVVEQLLQHGAQPDVCDDGGYTVLHNACNQPGAPLVSALLQHPKVRALVNAVTSSGDTAVSLALTGGNYKAVQQLVAAGADVNLRVDGMTPLHMVLHAASRRHGWYHGYGHIMSTVEALLAAGADANAVVEGVAVPNAAGAGLEGMDPLQLAVRANETAAVLLLVTPTNLRRLCQRQVQQASSSQEQQQQQQQEEEEGVEQLPPHKVVAIIAESVNLLLLHLHDDDTDFVGVALRFFSAVMEVLGAAATAHVLQQALQGCGYVHEEKLAVLLGVTRRKWVAGMPWLQRKWRVTHRVQQLVIQPLQQQAQQQPQVQQGANGASAATAEDQAQQPQGGRRQATDVCLRLWTEAEEAAGAGDWRLFVQRLEQLTELRPAWATYPLAAFAEKQGRGVEGVAGLCAALLVAWWEAEQQPAARTAAIKKHTREMAAAVVAAVKSWDQQRMRCSSCSS